MSGLCMAIGLQRAGIHDFVIVEKQPGLGGTWWDNTYPGAHVDVPSPVYSLQLRAQPRLVAPLCLGPGNPGLHAALAEKHGLLAAHAPRHPAHRGHLR
jgi:cation diffusion facilitator CzcD-associated flavoprotein CzcO